VRDGDLIELDVPGRRITLKVEDEELARRRAGWEPLPARYTRGVLAKYARLVGPASGGAVCD
jgi:dihydroxy-acid dehydratase